MEDEDLPGCKISDIPPDGYVFEDVMSVGIWSKIFRAVEGSSSPVAMKAVIACPKTMPLIEAEMEAMACIAQSPHPNVIKLAGDVMVTEDTAYFPLEWCTKDMMAVLEQRIVAKTKNSHAGLTMAETATLLSHAAAGLAHCHQANILHLDVKPENICVGTDGYLKVIDFGCSRMTSNKIQEKGSTAAYSAPETSPPHSAYDGKAADVWSLGVAVASCAAGAAVWFSHGNNASAAAAACIAAKKPETRLQIWIRKWREVVLSLGKATLCEYASGWAEGKRAAAAVNVVLESVPCVKKVSDVMCEFFMKDLKMQHLCGHLDPRLLQILVQMLCPYPQFRPTMAQIANDQWLDTVRTCFFCKTVPVVE